MIRGFAAAAGAILICLAAASCRTAPDGVALPRLKPGADPTGEAVRVKGRLVRSGACLAVGGNGSTVVVWPIAAAAEARGGGGGNVIIVWPRTATAQARGDGGGTTIIVWPFRRTDPPIRSGEEVEMNGILIATVDNISGYARIPADPGCRGERYLVVREARAG